ncbi:hypothetical protein EV363DRAFT_1316200 [Boletus edulis]|uniref:Uncharacterized protein n=1 Tax=Boletus edulis BED1 TaxID=1328754 RepID=A0AAD4BN69_BOLED|nr:hypothetical protein EV363DRAFT_1348713 [Boletus edulis]KAF8136989.1 hypothetical protein EV363DRAFT_1316200 [Boletus edulis]KAF8434844.1 hypothetical protein L210DRAFT_3552646 [Boletus edulis BED1]
MAMTLDESGVVGIDDEGNRNNKHEAEASETMDIRDQACLNLVKKRKKSSSSPPISPPIAKRLRSQSRGRASQHRPPSSSQLAMSKPASASTRSSSFTKPNCQPEAVVKIGPPKGAKSKFTSFFLPKSIYKIAELPSLPAAAIAAPSKLSSQPLPIVSTSNDCGGTYRQTRSRSQRTCSSQLAPIARSPRPTPSQTGLQSGPAYSLQGGPPTTSEFEHLVRQCGTTEARVQEMDSSQRQCALRIEALENALTSVLRIVETIMAVQEKARLREMSGGVGQKIMDE